ncbi:hypothetical protein [Actinoplanes sp. NPDC023714]|uniref:hypothetical protein n=1 Tax=Actinoplanes sp. NPDC023714 TaxID=3154322 RepID=UPI0033D2257A
MAEAGTEAGAVADAGDQGASIGSAAAKEDEAGAAKEDVAGAVNEDGSGAAKEDEAGTSAAGVSLRRTTGSAPESPARRAPPRGPSRRAPPIGPSLKPNEALPGPPGDAGPNSGAGLAADSTTGAGPDEAAGADLEPDGDEDSDDGEGDDETTDGRAERAPVDCRGGMVVRVGDDRVRSGRLPESPAFFAGTNGFGRNDSSSAATGATSAPPAVESCAPALNHPPAGVSVAAFGIVAPGRRCGRSVSVTAGSDDVPTAVRSTAIPPCDASRVRPPNGVRTKSPAG